jgi:hypothetical protein
MKKKTIWLYLIYSTLVCASHNLTAHNGVITYITPRSQSTNLSRDLLGFWDRIIAQTDADKPIKTAFAIIPETTRSFWNDQIEQCLFGQSTLECDRKKRMCDRKKTLTISGSRTERTDNDWLADYFGLPTDFCSSINTEPRAKGTSINCNFSIGLDPIIPGLYATVHLPIAHTNWDLKLEEYIKESGNNNHDPGYFNPAGTDRTQLVDSFTTFISGCAAPTITDIEFQPLRYAKMSSCKLTKTRLAEASFTLGWALCNTQEKYFDISGFINIPGGNKPKGEFLFEPIVGNGHHWELGIATSGYLLLRENQEETLGLYGKIKIGHLFATQQIRSFDLIERPLSRYMLATCMSDEITHNLRGQRNGTLTTPSAQFKPVITPIANLTTTPIKVSAAIQVEAATMFSYTKDHFSWLIGYTFWHRSKDIIKLDGPTPLDCNSAWAIKGDAHVIGFENNTNNTPIPLSASQSTASINRGRNFGLRGATTQDLVQNGRKNPRIDNPAPAFADSQDNATFNIITATPGGNTTTDQINTSLDALLITSCDIDLSSACTKSSTHTLFAHVERIWKGKDPFTPFFGFGAKIEFGPQAAPIHIENKQTCINCALSNWGFWFKAGFSYH